jgi:hypothetical protein
MWCGHLAATFAPDFCYFLVAKRVRYMAQSHKLNTGQAAFGRKKCGRKKSK